MFYIISQDVFAKNRKNSKNILVGVHYTLNRHMQFSTYLHILYHLLL